MSQTLLGRTVLELRRRQLQCLAKKLCIGMISQEALIGVTRLSCVARFLSGEFDEEIDDAFNPQEVLRYRPWVKSSLVETEKHTEQRLIDDSAQMVVAAEYVARQVAQGASVEVENEVVEAGDRTRRRADETPEKFRSSYGMSLRSAACANSRIVGRS